MEHKYQQVLQEMMISLCNKMNPEDMKVALHAQGILTYNELKQLCLPTYTSNEMKQSLLPGMVGNWVKQIRKKRGDIASPWKKNQFIVMALFRKEKTAFDVFVSCLQDTSEDNPSHRELLEELSRKLTVAHDALAWSPAKETDGEVQTSSTTQIVATECGCLRGVDQVIAETEIILTVEPQSFEWKDCGFKLHAPLGALPVGSAPCQIYVKASLSGQFLFPEGSELVSPIYWIYTPKNLQFSKPLTVEIQYCATIEQDDDSDFTFVVAKCTQPNLPYKFRTLDSGVFTPSCSYGSIYLTHFSGLGIISKQRKCRSYCAHTYVTNRGRDDWRVYFVIIRDLDIVYKAVDAHYGSFARKDATLRVAFEQGEISLDIPKEGRLTNEGWRILPRSYPSISKKEADEFRLGQWIPECELIVEWEKSGQQPVRLRHQVSLIGAKAPRNYFCIAIKPEWEEKEASIPHPSLSVQEQPTQQQVTQDLGAKYVAGVNDAPQLPDLMNEVAAHIPNKWRELGIELQLTPSELDCFSVASLGDMLRCFSSVFTVWKNRMSRDPYSWLTVIEALRAPAVGENRLAQKLSDKLIYQSPQSVQPCTV